MDPVNLEVIQFYAQPFIPSEPDWSPIPGWAQPRPTKQLYDPLTPEDLFDLTNAMMRTLDLLNIENLDALKSANHGRHISDVRGVSPWKLLLLAVTDQIPFDGPDNTEAGDHILDGIVTNACVLAALELDEFIEAHPAATPLDKETASVLRQEGFYNAPINWSTTIECAQTLVLMWEHLQHPSLFTGCAPI